MSTQQNTPLRDALLIKVEEFEKEFHIQSDKPKRNEKKKTLCWIAKLKRCLRKKKKQRTTIATIKYPHQFIEIYEFYVPQLIDVYLIGNQEFQYNILFYFVFYTHFSLRLKISFSFKIFGTIAAEMKFRIL